MQNDLVVLLKKNIKRGETFSHFTRCLRNYRKSILQLRTSVMGRLRDLQFISAITSGTLVFIIFTFLTVFSIFQDTLLEVSERLRDTDKGNQLLDIIELIVP